MKRPYSYRARLALAIMFVCGAAGSGFSADRSTNAPGSSPRQLGYADFKVISERNIFNPRRRAQQIQTDREVVRRPRRTESFSLVGIIQADSGPMAFFDGTHRKMAQVGEAVGDYKLTSIAPGYVTLATGSNSTVQLAVGRQLRREDSGPWRESAPPESSSSRFTYQPTPRPGQVPSVASASSPPMMQPNGFEPGPAVMVDPNTGLIVGEPPADGQTPQPVLTVQTLQTDAPGMTNAAPQSSELPPGADNDVLRRLMERREQEMNR